MNIRDLRYVLAVAETGHFGRAAEQCHVSQPTLSAQIAKLEAQLGLSLFERQPRDVRLSAAGAALLPRIRAILQGVDDLSLAAKDWQNPLAGSLRLGMIPTVGPHWLPHVLGPIKAALPDLVLRPQELQSAQCIAGLHEGSLDAAVLALPYAGSEAFACEPLFDEAFELCLPVDHPLARQRAAPRVDALKGESLLLLEHGHCLREHAQAFCRFDGVEQEYRATSLETLRQLTATGYGITLMPELAVAQAGAPRRAGDLAAHSPKVLYRRLQAPAPGRRIALLWRKSCPRQALYQALLECLRGVRLPLHRGATQLA